MLNLNSLQGPSKRSVDGGAETVPGERPRGGAARLRGALASTQERAR